MKRKALTLVALAVLTALILAAFWDELVVWASWRSGKPVVLVKLNVFLRGVDADKCFIAVYRFPTMYVPAGGLVSAQVVPPKATVTLMEFVPGIPVKVRFDEASRQYVVDYYEPQEYLVIAHCTRGGKTVFRVGRTVEVYPRSIVHREDVDLGRLASEPRLQQLSPEAIVEAKQSPFLSCPYTRSIAAGTATRRYAHA